MTKTSRTPYALYNKGALPMLGLGGHWGGGHYGDSDGRWEATTGGGPEHLAAQDHASPQLWQDLWAKLFQA